MITAERLHRARRTARLARRAGRVALHVQGRIARLAPPGDLAANLTFPLDRYMRFHQTSGTRGRPLVVLDTADDWHWWIDCWQFVFDAAEVTPATWC